MGFDAMRMAVAAQSLWPRMAVLAFARPPADRARPADPAPRRSLATGHSPGDRGKNPRAKLKRQRFGHGCRPPYPADSLNHLSPDLGILSDSISQDTALASQKQRDRAALDSGLRRCCQE